MIRGLRRGLEREVTMDKWQQRAYEKKKAREKQLRRRLTIAGGVAVAAAETPSHDSRWRRGSSRGIGHFCRDTA